VHITRIVEKKNAYGIYHGKLEGNRALRRPRHKWEYNMIGVGRYYWINLDYWRDFMNAVLNHRVSINAKKFSNS
jgi:hypothetical protein